MFGKHKKQVCYGNTAPVEMVQVKIMNQPLHSLNSASLYDPHFHHHSQRHPGKHGELMREQEV